MKEPTRNILRCLCLLSDGVNRSVYEMENLMGVSSRTIYNYMEVFETVGFVIDRNNGFPRLMQHPRVLLPCMYQLDAKERKTQIISHAIQHKCQVILKCYHSGNSNSVVDRRVEPVHFSKHNRQIYAFDVKKQDMRTFVISRAEDIVITDTPFTFESQHRQLECDCFWMTGDIIEEVTLQLDELALNLLHEEYPLSLQYPLRQDEQGSAKCITLPIRSVYGIGRFAMGLLGHCIILSGDSVLHFINDQIASHRPKKRRKHPTTAPHKRPTPPKKMA